MFTPTGIITPVRVNELIPRECFCMLYAQQVNLFGMRAVLCLLPAPYIMMCDLLTLVGRPLRGGDRVGASAPNIEESIAALFHDRSV